MHVVEGGGTRLRGGESAVAIDPARVQQRMVEAELSGRPALGAREAATALCVLAVAFHEDPQDVIQEPSCESEALIRAS